MSAMEVGERLVEVEALAVAEERRPAGDEKTFRAYDPDQVLLMAPVLAKWVPEGDLAHFVSDLVESALDLGPIYASYEDERGYPPQSWPDLLIEMGSAGAILRPDKPPRGVSGQPRRSTRRATYDIGSSHTAGFGPVTPKASFGAARTVARCGLPHTAHDRGRSLTARALLASGFVEVGWRIVAWVVPSPLRIDAPTSP